MKTATIDARIANSISLLNRCRAAHAEAALAAADGGDEEAVRQIELEIHGHELTLNRLQAARSAHVASQSQAVIDADLAERERNRSLERELGDKLGKQAQKLVRHIEQLAPLVAEFDALARERSAAVSAVLRCCAGRLEIGLAGSVAYDAGMREHPVPAAVAAALHRSGLCDTLRLERLGVRTVLPDGPYYSGDIGLTLASALKVATIQTEKSIDTLFEVAARKHRQGSP